MTSISTQTHWLFNWDSFWKHISWHDICPTPTNKNENLSTLKINIEIRTLQLTRSIRWLLFKLPYQLKFQPQPLHQPTFYTMRGDPFLNPEIKKKCIHFHSKKKFLMSCLMSCHHIKESNNNKEKETESTWYATQQESPFKPTKFLK